MAIILGVKINNLKQEEVLNKITGFLDDGKFHQIATVGPEFVLKAQKNEEFKNILNGCDLNVADGFGIKCAFWRFGKHLKSRFSGADLMFKLLKMAEDRGLGVFLACQKDGLSSFEETKEAILKMYPKLEINGKNINIESAIATPPWREKQFCDLWNEIATVTALPHNDKMILFCNFGAPHQEVFLNQQKNAIIGVAMGVGGTFDFLTGKVRRAPLFLRKVGLEWLWRLFQQPRRWKRIWNAAIVFPIKVIFNK